MARGAIVGTTGRFLSKSDHIPMYFMGYWREGLKIAAFKQKLNSKHKLPEIAQIFLESIALSAVALFSLPRELIPMVKRNMPNLLQETS